MSLKTLVTVVFLLIAFSLTVHGESEFFKKFKNDYDILDQDLLNNTAEIGAVKDFIYQKDLATFTFTEGNFHLLRFIDGRPTTAFFIGKGHAKIPVPSHVEQQGLMYASGNTEVDQDFDFCFIRMADNLDLKLKEKFPFETTNLKWEEYNMTKKEQGDIFFLPKILHDYDNYFQLLRSAYERTDNGYFWMDFNRYEFSFDPNRPEEVCVGYERKGGAELTTTKGAVMQRKERNIYDDSRMSEISYPTTILSRNVTCDFGGLDGKTINFAMADVKIQINRDSLRYLSLFLHYNLTLDSMFVDGTPVDFKRRKTFNSIGVILPRVYYKGDSLVAKVWYHGTKYFQMFPYVENLSPSPLTLKISALDDFNYIMPDIKNVKKEKGKQFIEVETSLPYRDFFVEAYSTACQKIPMTTYLGLPLTIIKSPYFIKGNFDCFVPEDTFQVVTQQALDFMGARLGAPPGAFDFTVLPVEFKNVVPKTMPGVIEPYHEYCILDGTGGFQYPAGREAARQWFGSLMRPVSERDLWLVDALPEYLGLMFVQGSFQKGQFYNELAYMKNRLTTIAGRGEDLPIGVGSSRISDTLRVIKGPWVLHMLRMVMCDVEKLSDRQFNKFMAELVYMVNNKEFTNTDVQKLAEKHYGQPLDWFFNEWVYGRNIPQYDVTYSIVPKDNQFVIDVSTTTKNVGADFKYPVIIRVGTEDGNSAYFKQMIAGATNSFQLGPFASKPKDFKFNEFFSVLSEDKVDKAK
jgi:hypothetical protein